MPAEKDISFDCVIIGGGLAGLCLSIQLAKKKYRVAVLEKNEYPFHKVCGEYISMESWPFLENLGLKLSALGLPTIHSLSITAQNGFSISSALDLGGFGITRYNLDFALVKLARENGVQVFENCKATNVAFNNLYRVETTTGSFSARLVFGSYGKLKPGFIKKSKSTKKGDYIAVKYHIKTAFPDSLIELHNFKNGYCGISKVEDNMLCLCYLTTQNNLQENNNDIQQLEKNVVMKNPHLRKYFSESEFISRKPLVISQIGFSKVGTSQNNILLLGDSAGAIAPLCGNGMSIAMRSSKILFHHIDDYFQGIITKKELEKRYQEEWDNNFSLRIKTGYYLQFLFGKKTSTLLALKLLKLFPSLFRKLILLTHGKPF